MDTPNETQTAVAENPVAPVAGGSEVAKPETATAPENEPAPNVDAPEAPTSATLPAYIRKCRHCEAEYPAHLKRCPGCGKSQAGATAGPRKPRQSAPQVSALPIPPPAPPPKPAFVPTERQMMQLEEALAETVTFLCEDIAAPIVLRGRKQVPPFGEKRALKIGAAWAPLLAPHMGPGVLLMLLAIAVTVRGLGGYIRELREAPPSQLKLPLAPPTPTVIPNL